MANEVKGTFIDRLDLVKQVKQRVSAPSFTLAIKLTFSTESQASKRFILLLVRSRSPWQRTVVYTMLHIESYYRSSKDYYFVFRYQILSQKLKRNA